MLTQMLISKSWNRRAARNIGVLIMLFTDVSPEVTVQATGVGNNSVGGTNNSKMHYLPIQIGWS